MAVSALQYLIPKPRVPWTATQEKSVSQDYPLVIKTLECGDDFTARTYFQFLWLPESIMPLGLFVPSMLRVRPTDDATDLHPLHGMLERLLSTTRMVKNKYHEELPHILANGGGKGEEEESIMWYAISHEKSEGDDDDEPWHNNAWRSAWTERMERREVQIQILLYMLKLSLPSPPPLPEASSPSRKRRKLEAPPASLEDRLEAFMDKLSTWQLTRSLEEGLLHRSRDRDWMQAFCEDVVEPQFKATLPAQVSLLRSKVFPHSPFSDSENSEDERATSPGLPAKRAPSTSAVLRKTLAEPIRSRSRSLSITLAQEREREQQREESVGAKRRVLNREVSMKRAFKPRERDARSIEAERKEKERKKEEKAKAEEARLEAIREKERREGVLLVAATPVKSKSRPSTGRGASEETRGWSPDPLAMDI